MRFRSSRRRDQDGDELVHLVHQAIRRPIIQPVGALRDSQPVVRFAELLRSNSDLVSRFASGSFLALRSLVHEVRGAFGTSCLSIVGAATRRRTPELLSDMPRRGVDLQRRQESPHTFHNLEQPVREVIALALPSPVVVGSLFLVPCSLFASAFHTHLSSRRHAPLHKKRVGRHHLQRVVPKAAVRSLSARNRGSPRNELSKMSLI